MCTLKIYIYFTLKFLDINLKNLESKMKMCELHIEFRKSYLNETLFLYLFKMFDL